MGHQVNLVHIIEISDYKNASSFRAVKLQQSSMSTFSAELLRLVKSKIKTYTTPSLLEGLYF